MHTVDLIAQAIASLPDTPDISGVVNGICCLTGKEGSCIARTEIFGKSFTQQNLFSAPASEHVGVNTAIAMGYKWERMSIWMTTAREFRRFEKDSKPELRRIILEGDYPREPWAGYVTTSYKKHGALTAPVNSPGSALWGFDERVVDCSDLATVNDFYNRLYAAKVAGIGNDTLETMIAQPITIKCCGVPAWLEFERWARPRYCSGLYQFCRWLLPPMEEIKAEQKTKDNLL